MTTKKHDRQLIFAVFTLVILSHVLTWAYRNGVIDAILDKI